MDKFNKLFVAGAFDSFHMGHQFFLWKASSMCKELVVVVARDETIKRIKNKTLTVIMIPVYEEKKRDLSIFTSSPRVSSLTYQKS